MVLYRRKRPLGERTWSRYWYCLTGANRSPNRSSRSSRTKPDSRPKTGSRMYFWPEPVTEGTRHIAKQMLSSDCRREYHQLELVTARDCLQAEQPHAVSISLTGPTGRMSGVGQAVRPRICQDGRTDGTENSPSVTVDHWGNQHTIANRGQRSVTAQPRSGLAVGHGSRPPRPSSHCRQHRGRRPPSARFPTLGRPIRYRS